MEDREFHLEMVSLERHSSCFEHDELWKVQSLMMEKPKQKEERMQGRRGRRGKVPPSSPFSVQERKTKQKPKKGGCKNSENQHLFCAHPPLLEAQKEEEEKKRKFVDVQKKPFSLDEKHHLF
jgi:hypothetical protein